MWIPLDKAHYVMFCKITKMYEIAKAFLAEGLQIKIIQFFTQHNLFPWGDWKELDRVNATRGSNLRMNWKGQLDQVSEQNVCYGQLIHYCIRRKKKNTNLS